MIVHKTAPACVPGNKHFFVVWEQASLELNEEGCCSPQCLVVVGVPVFVFLWFSFSPPPALSEDQGGGMVTSWCSYAICQGQVSKHSAAVELGPRCGWGPWPPGSNEISDLLLPLLLQLLWFPGSCCGHACLTVWKAAAGNAASTERLWELALETYSRWGCPEPCQPLAIPAELICLHPRLWKHSFPPDYSFFGRKWGEGCLFSSEIKQCLPSNLLVMLELQQNHIWEE